MIGWLHGGNNMPENTTNNSKDVIIDPVTKQWQKGTPSPNPGGRPSRKKFTELLNKTFTDENIIFMLFAKSHGIDTNFSDAKNILKLIEDPCVNKRFRKYINKIKAGKKDVRSKWNRLGENDQVSLMKWIAEQKIGRAVQQINAEIDNKVTQVTVALPDNIDEKDF